MTRIRKEQWLAWKFQCEFCEHEFEVKSPGVDYAMLVYCLNCCTATGKIIENIGGDVAVHELDGDHTSAVELGPNNLNRPTPGVFIDLGCAGVMAPAFANVHRPCVICTPTPTQNMLVHSVAEAYEHIDPNDTVARNAASQHFIRCCAPHGLWLIPHPDMGERL